MKRYFFNLIENFNKKAIAAMMIGAIATSLLAQTGSPPVVSIIDPLNGSIAEGKQTLITYVVSVATPQSVKISVDDKAVQLITDVSLGENTVTVDIPEKDCTITVVAQNEHGAGEPATVNLKRSGNIFKPTLYVLAIGVSNYNNRDLQLQFPAKDASDFTQAMLRQAGLLYERVELKLLADRSATEVNIRDGLNWLQKQTTNRDIAMLFMAGHGINNYAGEFYFMPVNADLERINATCVGYREIKNTISNVPGKLLVFMDACHSGNVLGNQRSSNSINDAVNEIASASNAPVVYTSSTEAQYSLESTEWNNGAFTKALIEGLLGKADMTGNKMITIKSLDYYIAQRVKELTQGKQSPTTIIPNSVSDFPIAIVTDEMRTGGVAIISEHSTFSSRRRTSEILVGLSSGVGVYGDIPFGDVISGNATVIGADAAWFMNKYLGVGVKWNIGISKVYFGEAIYSERMNFAGPTVYFRWLKRNRLSVITSASAGTMNWNWTWNDDFAAEETGSATSVGGFLTTGINFMLTPNIGIGANIQTALGSVKDNKGNLRKPAGAGGTIGLVFSF